MVDAKPDVLAIFSEALAQPTDEDRSNYIEKACGDDIELRRRLHDLLRAHRDAGHFLGSATSATVAQPRLTEQAGTVTGPYKLLQQIGEGGMGVVFMAEQIHPVQRTVALKIVKPGMDTRQVIARFEAERQALAMMDHPNIARIIDAGTTDTGRPYFVMELVKGVPITEYCDQQHLTVRQRLELFTQVCHAVQHAHQKGIIHRDLKPSNVLVAEYDGKPVPKVIDFGVAKATAQRLTERTMFTQYGQIVGTFEYMSPEQARFNQLDVDTRSDIYSLGVLLYELLAGSTPLEKERLRSAAFDEILRIISEEDPPHPSTRLSSLRTTSGSLPSAGRVEEGGAYDSATIAANRNSDPAKLTKELSGELDWIVMKCLEKDRNRRYETASSLAMDLQHHLTDEPVAACPPSIAYRLKKFIRRNKVSVSAGFAVAAALVIGLVLASIGFMQARRQAEIARMEAARSEQVAQFLKDMLAAAGPAVAAGRDSTLLRGILDTTAKRIANDLKNQPEVEAELLTVIGTTYAAIGETAEAVATHQKALATYRQLDGGESPELASLLTKLGVELSYLGNQTEAEPVVREALAMWRKLHGNESAKAAGQLGDLALVLVRQAESAPEPRKQTKLAEAESLEREALAIFRKLRAEIGESTGVVDTAPYIDSEKRVAHTLTRLAVILGNQGKSTEAESAAREALARFTKLYGSNHRLQLHAMHILAVAIANHKPEEAESLEREAVAGLREYMGDVKQHPDLAYSVHNFARLLQKNGKLIEAEAAHREALAIWKKVLADGHPYVADSLDNLGEVLRAQDKLPEAEDRFREALHLKSKKSGKESPNTIATLNALIDVLQREGKTTEAENLRREYTAPNRPAEEALPGTNPTLVSPRISDD